MRDGAWPASYQVSVHSIVSRFTTEEKAKRDSFLFMPFGNGPRNCIGMRFAMMEMKMVLVRMLKEFKLEVCSKTEVRLSCHTTRNHVYTLLSGFRIDEN